MLRVGGKVINIAIPEEPPMPIPIRQLNSYGVFIGGSHVGGISEISKMLEIAATKKPKFLVEQRPMKDANSTVLDMVAGKARFRYTLVN